MVVELLFLVGRRRIVVPFPKKLRRLDMGPMRIYDTMIHLDHSGHAYLHSAIPYSKPPNFRSFAWCLWSLAIQVCPAEEPIAAKPEQVSCLVWWRCWSRPGGRADLVCLAPTNYTLE